MDGLQRVRQAQKTSTRSMPRAFVERIICAASRRRQNDSQRYFGGLSAAVRDFVRAKTEGGTMSEQTRVRHPLYNLLPADVEGFDSLLELALDMRWTWNHATDEVWRQLDPVMWTLRRHPCDVLQTVSREKIRRVLADPAFRKKIDALVQSKKQAEEAPAWFQQHHPEVPLTCVAYFSMEFMLSEALPIYSGGSVS